MRAGELWWNDKFSSFEIAVDKLCPPSLDFGDAIRSATVKTGRYRDGIAINTKALQGVEPLSKHFGIWKHAKMIDLASEEATQRAQVAVQNLDKMLADFRSKVGNDLSSIKAASQRVQTETQSMADKYKAARDLLTSPEFEHAIANAERMAAALEAIGRLSETKLSVAVFSGGQQKAD